jgi:hypothetical protein
MWLQEVARPEPVRHRQVTQPSSRGPSSPMTALRGSRKLAIEDPGAIHATVLSFL